VGPYIFAIAIFIVIGVVGSIWNARVDRNSPFDWDRLGDELETAADTMSNLEKRGDDRQAVRPVSFRFQGEGSAIEQARRELRSCGWQVVSSSDAPNRTTTLIVRRDQSMDGEIVMAAIEQALTVERAYGARFLGLTPDDCSLAI